MLAYEVLLIRLFAIVQWHYFAYMAISIALLGFGASGTFIFLAQGWLRPHFTAAFVVNAAAFGITGLTGFIVAQRLPFNALEVAWEPRQLLFLLIHYILFVVPFFAGANCIGLAFAHFGKQIGRIYAFNLGGSGLGALGLIGLLQLATAEEVLRLIAGLGFAAAGLASLSAAHRRLIPAMLFALALMVALLTPPSWTALRISPYKGLSMALAVPGARVLGESSSPLGLLTVVDSPQVPFHHAPGLSLNASAGPPPQLGIFTDGDGITAITAFTGDFSPLAYLEYTTSALPYDLLEAPDVLILGAGGGSDVLQALRHGAAAIDAVELNPQLVHLIAETHREFAGNLYSRPEVRLHVAEARSFVSGSAATWDLIQIPLLDSFAAAAAGVYGVSESYIYTVEAFGDYLRHLRPGGYLAITRWLKLPPRDSLKLFATATEALGRAGVAAPERRIALIRGWNTTTLLVRNGDLGRSELAGIRAFAEARSFDLAHLPGMASSEANRAKGPGRYRAWRLPRPLQV
jgi:SAM-dependent methyltransferase